MKTAKEILHDKAHQYNDGFMTGQPKWIVEAMEEYAKQFKEKEIIIQCPKCDKDFVFPLKQIA